MPHETAIPPRRNLRSLKSLTTLAGGYLLTATCFWLAVTGAVQRTYEVTAIGTCSGLFFGLGCVILTRQTIQALHRPTYQPVAFPEDNDPTDDPLDTGRAPQRQGPRKEAIASTFRLFVTVYFLTQPHAKHQQPTLVWYTMRKRPVMVRGCRPSMASP